MIWRHIFIDTAPIPWFREEEVKYYPSGESHFEDLLLELEKARQFIFLEYFIIDEGYMWGKGTEHVFGKKVQGGRGGPSHV